MKSPLTINTKTVSLVTVDVFTDRPFVGNPAAVCLLDTAAPDTWMQNVAAELNLSDTAFLVPVEDGFSLRWFTPTGEVDLCGHATLASAHSLWESGYLSENRPLRFHTRSGLLTAQLVREASEAWVELDFPAEIVHPIKSPENLGKALGACPIFIGKNRMDYLVELSSEEEVRRLDPDFRELSSIEARGVVVTARGIGRADIVSRCFYPRLGINEDPVTGSAHCALAPYWSERLNKSELLAYQASRRGGWLRLRHLGDRVKILGQAVTVLRGELLYSERS